MKHTNFTTQTKRKTTCRISFFFFFSPFFSFFGILGCKSWKTTNNKWNRITETRNLEGKYEDKNRKENNQQHTFFLFFLFFFSVSSWKAYTITWKTGNSNNLKLLEMGFRNQEWQWMGFRNGLQEVGMCMSARHTVNETCYKNAKSR